MGKSPNARRRGTRWLAVLLTFALCATAVRADEDLPTRVGRVSELGGALYLAPQDRSSDWAAIALNYPITGGDEISVAPDGRAEIDFGSGQLRLAGATDVQVTALDEGRFALFVASGRIILRLRTLDPGDSATIDTPHTQIRLDRPGSYRVEVAPDREQTVLIVRDGEADMRVDGGAQQVLRGQTATIAASDPANVALSDGFGTDGFDAWSAVRDRAYETSPSAAYVSREMVGSSDLGYYGSWESTPSYGNVWFPTTVAVGWAPYRFGHWVWCGPWGWTWVDDAPWGYAPFHYGRWVYLSGRWGWCPGAFVRRPVWAPALVEWFGGPGWTFSATSAAPIFGWIPLAWGEPFRPHWRCSAECWRRLNAPYAVTAIRGSAAAHLANSDVPGAVSAVSGNILSDGRPVAANLVRVSRTALASAPVLASAPAAQVPPSTMARRRLAEPAAAAPSVPAARPRVASPAPMPRVYGGVTDGRGAYTGVAPTPGPKLPSSADRGYALLPVPRSAGHTLPPPTFVPTPAVPAAPLIVPTQGARPTGHDAPAAKGAAPAPVNPALGGAQPK